MRASAVARAAFLGAAVAVGAAGIAARRAPAALSAPAVSAAATIADTAAADLPAAAGATPAALLLRTRVAQGELSGITEESGSRAVAAYLGIPYAAPPVGPSRWRAPRPARPWQGVRAADEYAPSCYQPLTPNGFGPWTAEYVVHGKVSEDCLYLNIWTPARSRGAKLPVLLWIYGGGFSTGSGSVPIYDGAALAARGIVVVDINYRLGVFGFLADPALSAESAHHTSGNYGLLDMLSALHWVQRNIAAFGGDPAAVTIAGQSAGAAAVVDLDASPLARGLYARAIAESGVGLNMPMMSLAAADRAGERFARSKGAASLGALRALPPQELMARGPPGVVFAPIIDGRVLPAAPATALAEGRVNPTPFLTGLVAEENSAMNPHYGTMSLQQCDAAIARMFGTQAAVFRRLYLGAGQDAGAGGGASRDGSGGGSDCNVPLEHLLRDRGVASTYFWARERSRHTSQRIFIYLYDHAEPGPQAARYGTFHSSEIPYVFDTLDKSPDRPFTPHDRAIAATMSAYWVNFIRSGNPNGSALPHWPVFDPSADQIMELGDRFAPRAILGAQQLAAMKRYEASGGTIGIF